MPANEIIHALRQCVEKVNDDRVAGEMVQKLNQLQEVANRTHETLHQQARQLEDLKAQSDQPRTLSAVWPGLCYDPAV
jgi:hypothetical protein